MSSPGLTKHGTCTSEPQRLPARPQDSTGVLTAAAFGSDPGLHPLPAARTVEQRWLRAVALGGQGRYGAARAELARLRPHIGTTGIWASLVASTEASLLRQLGGHRDAAVSDGRAVAAAGGTGVGDDRGELDIRIVHARCDALTGLAADALGVGRTALARDLLGRCGTVLAAAEEPGGDDRFLRQRIRLEWVTAETALAEGDFATARVHADRAVVVSARYGSVRHAVKSDLIRAASMTGETDLDPARALATKVFDRSGDHGLIPLRWAAAMLLDGLGGHADAAGARDECAASIVRRGGRFTTIRP